MPTDDPYAIFFHEYLRSATELTAKIALHLDRLAVDPSAAEDLVELRRAWHSLRGNSAFVPDCPITAMAESAEEAVEAVIAGPSAIGPLVAPLRTVLGEAQAWVNAASTTTGRRDARSSRELVAALAALAAARRAASAPHRYFYGGEDVSDLLEMLEREETAAGAAGMGHGTVHPPAPPELGAALERIARLAKLEGETAAAELAAARTGEIRDVIRFLAARVTCVTGR